MLQAAFSGEFMGKMVQAGLEPTALVLCLDIPFQTFENFSSCLRRIKTKFVLQQNIYFAKSA